MKHTRAAVAAATIAAGLAPRAALANGRFPAAGQVVVDPGDAKHLVLRTTYGLLQTTDSGSSWRWICEQAVGYGGTEDPAMGVTGDGTLLAGFFEGLSVSHDRGCSWAFIAGPLDQQYTVDIAVESRLPARAVALASLGVKEGFHTVLAETVDDGKTWTQAGVAMPVDFLGLTVEMAPSMTDRIYVSGLAGASHAGAIEKSDDRGKTWKQFPFDLEGALAPYIGSVDPTNPERLYVRVDGGNADDQLYVSDDGASTWQKIFTCTHDMLGFALSPDGSKVAAGGPDAGLFVASTRDFVFSQVSPIGVKCLKWHRDGLYACADEFKDTFTLGLSQNDGATFEAIYHLPDLSPLECDVGTPTGNSCPAAWPGLASTIGAESASGDSGTAGRSSPEASAKSSQPPIASSSCALAGDAPWRASRGSRAAVFSAVAAIGLVARRRKRR
jgi:photosystem II stability/assembly factor-like uncharacterized protein